MNSEYLVSSLMEIRENIILIYGFNSFGKTRLLSPTKIGQNY